MDYQQLRQAVSAAFWRKEYNQAYAILEEYLQSAQGEDLGRALTLKASLIQGHEPEHSTQGLVLLDEALPLVRRSPGATMDVLMVALGLCHNLGDVDRARPYEEAAGRLLLEHSTDPEVRSRRCRLQFNLGQISALRGDHASAYWYFMQADQSLQAPEIPDKDRRFLSFLVQTETALACLRVGRLYEAQEALDLAETFSRDHPQRVRLYVYRGELLRRLGQLEEARSLLTGPASEAEHHDLAGIRVSYSVACALLAQDSGDLRSFHQFLARAAQEAADHRCDFWLSEIQRLQRSPEYKGGFR